MNEMNLVDNKELREQVASRIEVLDKVGDLLLLPNSDMATMSQVAQYYKVEGKTVEKVIERNHDEVLSDGYNVFTKDEILLTYNMSVKTKRGGFDILDENEQVLASGSNKGIALFPKRAILRVGMLLRDSEVAKEVRNQLLNLVDNTFETNAELLVKDIDEEKQLQIEVGIAWATGNMDDFALATKRLNDYKSRIIERMKPKEEAFDVYMDADGTYTVTNTCKMLGLKRSEVFVWLREKGLVFKNKAEATAKAVELGYFKQVIKDKYSSMVVTPKGVEYIRTKFNQ